MGLGLTKLACIGACIAALGLAGCGADGKDVSTASGGNGTEQTTTTSADDAGDDPSSESEEVAATSTTKPNKPSGPSIELAETGFSTYTDYDDTPAASAGAVLKNNGGATAEYFEVVFTFKDASGKPVGTESTTVYAVAPGAVGYASVGGVDLTGEPTSVDAASVVDEDSFIDTLALPVTVEGVVPEEYGDGIQVNGIAENKSDQVLEYFSVTCVLRSGGKIVGGADGTLDTLVPGGSIAWEATGPVKADAAECSAAGSV